MKKELIVSTEHTLGGCPRLDGRRLDVRHVIWGITEYDDGNVETYQRDFGVTNEQVAHAIMYCKEQKCEVKNVPHSCEGCSKKFRKDAATWEEYVKDFGGINLIETDNEPIIKLGDDTFLLGDVEDHKKDYEGSNTWETAAMLYEKMKGELELPETYNELIS